MHEKVERIKVKKYYFLKKENAIYDYPFDKVEATNIDGFYCVMMDGNAGYMKRNGEIVVPMRYDYNRRNYRGRLIKASLQWYKYNDTMITDVFKNNRVGAVNEEGEELVPCEFEEVAISDVQGKFFHVALLSDSKLVWGVYDVENQKIIIEPKYEKIKYNNDEYATGLIINGSWKILQYATGDEFATEGLKSLSSMCWDEYKVIKNHIDDKTYYGIYNFEKDEVTVKPIYKTLEYAGGDDYASFERDDKWGLLRLSDGTEILLPTYTIPITVFRNGVFEGILAKKSGRDTFGRYYYSETEDIHIRVIGEQSAPVVIQGYKYVNDRAHNILICSNNSNFTGSTYYQILNMKDYIGIVTYPQYKDNRSVSIIGTFGNVEYSYKNISAMNFRGENIPVTETMKTEIVKKAIKIYKS